MLNFTHAIFKENDDAKKCRGCGHLNPGDYNFCENCGMPLNDDVETQAEDTIEIEEEDVNVTDTEEQTETVTANEGHEPDENGGTATESADDRESSDNRDKGSRKKLIAGIIIGVIILAAAAVAIMMYLGDKASAEYSAKLKEADAYMEEMDYEKAETAYLEAIEIEPKESEAYVKVSDVYVVQEKYEEAENILEEGKDQAGGKEIDEKLEQVRSYGAYDDYINDVIIPEIGLADVDQELSYDMMTPGLISAITEDFDGDGMPDLLTVSCSEPGTMLIYIDLYSRVDGEIELLDEYELDCMALEGAASRYDIFLKENEDTTYIVIGGEWLLSHGGTGMVHVLEVGNEINTASEASWGIYMEFISYYVDGTEIARYSRDDYIDYSDNHSQQNNSYEWNQN